MESAHTEGSLDVVLLQERSAGTFAKVYMAEARSANGLARIVAVKVLREQWADSEEVMVRTQDEARLLAKLRHRNILRVEALTEIQGQPAIVMEFVDGLDLGQIISNLKKTRRRIPPRAAYKIALDTASAIEAAYFKVGYGMSTPLRVVHRDIKPSNIMLSVEGDVKVLDFGTARASFEGREAMTGAMRFGSLKYMSPERREGGRGQHAGDVYSLGLVLLEMLHGDILPLAPLDTEEHDRFFSKIIDGLIDLALPNQAWEASLKEAIGRMCSSDPAQRLTADQVVQLLRAFSEQASGRSLDGFAAEVVAELSAQLFGQQQQGELSGTHFRVLSEQEQARRQPQQPKPEQPTPEQPRTPQQPQAAQDSHGRVPPDGPKTEPIRLVEEGPTQPARDDPSPFQPLDFAPGADAFDDNLPDEMTLRAPLITAESLPSPARPVEPGERKRGAGGEQGAPRQQSARPGPKKGGGAGTAVIALVAGAVIFGGLAVLLLSIVAVAVLLLSRPTPAPVTVAAPVEQEAPAEGALAITLSGDDSIQWIKISDAQGNAVVTGKPNGTGSVAPGPYTLSAKVAARPKAEASLEVSTGMSLSCAPEKENRVRCTDEASGNAMLLEP